MQKDKQEKDNRQNSRKTYTPPTLEKRERLVEVTEGSQIESGVSP